jgi:16S rRNA (cytosine967-C5)-methyltransferase
VSPSARLTPALLGQAVDAATEALRFAGPADETLSRYFRSHRGLGQSERAFVAETVFAVLRRKRSLEAAAGSPQPRLLVAAALVRVLGYSGRALAGLFDEELIARLRATKSEAFPPAVQAELPDWLWQRLAAAHGEAEALRLAQALANPAPLDLRVNLARATREEVLSRLQADGLEAKATPYSPAGIRLSGRPPINRHPLFKEGLVEVRTRVASSSPGCSRRAAAR